MRQRAACRVLPDHHRGTQESASLKTTLALCGGHSCRARGGRPAGLADGGSGSRQVTRERRAGSQGTRRACACRPRPSARAGPAAPALRAGGPHVHAKGSGRCAAVSVRSSRVCTAPPRLCEGPTTAPVSPAPGHAEDLSVCGKAKSGGRPPLLRATVTSGGLSLGTGSGRISRKPTVLDGRAENRGQRDTAAGRRGGRPERQSRTGRARGPWENSQPGPLGPPARDAGPRAKRSHGLDRDSGAVAAGDT